MWLIATQRIAVQFYIMKRNCLRGKFSQFFKFFVKFAKLNLREFFIRFSIHLQQSCQKIFTGYQTI